jgi:hypothetical protein
VFELIEQLEQRNLKWVRLGRQHSVYGAACTVRNSKPSFSFVAFAACDAAFNCR